MKTEGMGSGDNVMSTVLSDLQKKFAKSKEYLSEMFDKSQSRVEERLGLSESLALQFALVPIKYPKDANKLERRLTKVLGANINQI